MIIGTRCRHCGTRRTYSQDKPGGELKPMSGSDPDYGCTVSPTGFCEPSVAATETAGERMVRELAENRSRRLMYGGRRKHR